MVAFDDSEQGHVERRPNQFDGAFEVVVVIPAQAVARVVHTARKPLDRAEVVSTNCDCARARARARAKLTIYQPLAVERLSYNNGR
jgi:hypothetical protein